MLHTLLFFPFSKCRLFHNATFFGSCIIHILNTGVLKFKRKFRRLKVKLSTVSIFNCLIFFKIFSLFYGQPELNWIGYLSTKLQSAGILHCVDQHLFAWGLENSAKMNFCYDLRSCGNLHSGNWFITDVSGQHIDSIFNDRKIQGIFIPFGYLGPRRWKQHAVQKFR